MTRGVRIAGLVWPLRRSAGPRPRNLREMRGFDPQKPIMATNQAKRAASKQALMSYTP